PRLAARAGAMSDLVVHLSNGITLAVPPSLQSVTTYVLLEQETWFEKELALLPHVLRPGMTAIDIGANLGIYALPMPRLVAPAPQFGPLAPWKGRGGGAGGGLRPGSGKAARGGGGRPAAS